MKNSLSIQEAADLARETGDTRALTAHWDQTRVALLHDCIKAFIDDPPPGVGRRTLSALGYAAWWLQFNLGHMREDS